MLLRGQTFWCHLGTQRLTANSGTGNRYNLSTRKRSRYLSPNECSYFSFGKSSDQNPFQIIFPWLRTLSYLAGFPVKITLSGSSGHRVNFGSGRWLTFYHSLNLLFGWGLICGMVAVLMQSSSTLQVRHYQWFYSESLNKLESKYYHLKA